MQKIVAKCHKTGALFCYSASGLWGKLQIRVGKSGLKRIYKTDNSKTDNFTRILHRKLQNLKKDLSYQEKPEKIKIP